MTTRLEVERTTREVGPEAPRREGSPAPDLYRRYGKRALDLALTVPALALLGPVMVGASLGVWASMGRPILFSQRRPGLGGRQFVLWKFRTMTHARRARGDLAPDAERLTTFGRWLRSTSVDELPTLLNVLRGEMSLVGPRPLLTDYLPRYTAEQARRHEVRPGITGAAQVRGRNALTWEEKFALDVWYVDHVSLATDLELLARTVRTVLLREGVSAPSHATMPEFLGTQDVGTR